MSTLMSGLGSVYWFLAGGTLAHLSTISPPPRPPYQPIRCQYNQTRPIRAQHYLATPPARQSVTVPPVVKGAATRLETGASVAILALTQLRSPMLPCSRIAGVLLGA